MGVAVVLVALDAVDHSLHCVLGEGEVAKHGGVACAPSSEWAGGRTREREGGGELCLQARLRLKKGDEAAQRRF